MPEFFAGGGKPNAPRHHCPTILRRERTASSCISIMVLGKRHTHICSRCHCCSNGRRPLSWARQRERFSCRPGTDRADGRGIPGNFLQSEERRQFLSAIL